MQKIVNQIFKAIGLCAIVLAVLFIATGCGVTQKAGDDGSNGADGLSGEDGRDYITPVIRPYTWDSTGLVLFFSDCGTITEPKLVNIGFGGQSSNDNYVAIKVPAGWMGHKLSVVINGSLAEMTIPSNIADTMVFLTSTGTDYPWGKYINCSKIDWDSSSSYFVWYLNGIQQELYYADTFKP